MKIEQRETVKLIKLPNQEGIRMLGEEENFGIVKADTIKKVVVKEKVRQEYLSRTRKHP